MSFYSKLSNIIGHYDNLKEKLSDPSVDRESFIALSKELSELDGYINFVHEYVKNHDEILQMETLLASAEHVDAEFKELIETELPVLKKQNENLENKIKIILLPKDVMDEKNAILEIRAGTGGDEAGLFASELFRMYQKYAESKKWKFEILSLSENGIGSIKEVVASISGKGVFSYLKYESGVHRVQRVPITESSGRVHTSTATVAVLPEAEEVDVQIDDKDLKIDVMRASGAGGQHVNKTESAVRITHIPTGIVVCQQDERSQHMNRAKAMKILLSRVYEIEHHKLHSERAQDRKNQVGTGDRSERIRTYNFPQGRVTDHRINLTLYKIALIMEGEFDDVVSALIDFDQQEKLKIAMEVEA